MVKHFYLMWRRIFSRRAHYYCWQRHRSKAQYTSWLHTSSHTLLIAFIWRFKRCLCIKYQWAALTTTKNMHDSLYLKNLLRLSLSHTHTRATDIFSSFFTTLEQCFMIFLRYHLFSGSFFIHPSCYPFYTQWCCCCLLVPILNAQWGKAVNTP